MQPLCVVGGVYIGSWHAHQLGSTAWGGELNGMDRQECLSYCSGQLRWDMGGKFAVEKRNDHAMNQRTAGFALADTSGWCCIDIGAGMFWHAQPRAIVFLLPR